MILIETIADLATHLVHVYKPEQKKRRTPYEEALEDLANSIILQAVDDYAKARMRKDHEVMADCVEFFNSDWYKALCPLMDNDAKTILGLIHKYYNPYSVRRDLI